MPLGKRETHDAVQTTNLWPNCPSQKINVDNVEDAEHMSDAREMWIRWTETCTNRAYLGLLADDPLSLKDGACVA